MTPPIYVDLDGVLADFELFLFNQYQVRIGDVDSATIWGLVNNYEDTVGEWFVDLPFREGAIALWSFLRPYHPIVLTATGRDVERVARQKRVWCMNKLGIADDRVITVRSSEDKAAYASPGAILIDDNGPRSIAAWTSAGGVGIVHTHTPLTIAHLKSIILG